MWVWVEGEYVGVGLAGIGVARGCLSRRGLSTWRSCGGVMRRSCAPRVPDATDAQGPAQTGAEEITRRAINQNKQFLKRYISLRIGVINRRMIASRLCVGLWVVGLFRDSVWVFLALTATL